MAYYVEYTVPATDDERIEIPVSDQESGYTVPLSETDAPVVHAKDLPIRSGVFGSSFDEARRAAEEIIGHSKASRAKLYEDGDNSNRVGAGKLIAEYTEGDGWSGH
ncbi:hypothetical protein [uncultured Arthrobacter sp.]|uniref:hypothetical protein n=1 Tax=uncultured Arthrobacter sp. TaxID=114050 RepID=UPI00262E271F|nr:hypothetical protein [uncultured Arthrobacter sp.]